ncbi:MAG: L-lactate dehydrogenase complex protein LldG, partial [Hyphomicrobiales bacterium]
MKARRGDDPRLAALPWGEQRTLEVTTGASDAHQLASASQVFGGIAETGALVLASGPDNPTTLNFLPDARIVVVAAVDIAALPRPINMITGPSRSADIDQILILGAHGSSARMCRWWVKLRKAERSKIAHPSEY